MGPKPIKLSGFYTLKTSGEEVTGFVDEDNEAKKEEPCCGGAYLGGYGHEEWEWAVFGRETKAQVGNGRMLTGLGRLARC